ncbi:proline-rich protein 2-like [Capricornis sumatraensis]|uniref:proline-rich protein 2-like n=1 Tax=Capricornis sumatraensis TaxID=34865 RepID=UPI003605027D
MQRKPERELPKPEGEPQPTNRSGPARPRTGTAAISSPQDAIGDHTEQQRLKSGQHLLRGKSNPGRVRGNKASTRQRTLETSGPRLEASSVPGQTAGSNNSAWRGPCVRLGDPDKVGETKTGRKANRRSLGLTEPQVGPTSGLRENRPPPPQPRRSRPPPESALHGPPPPSPVHRRAEGRPGPRALPLGRGGREGEAPTSARPAPSLPDYVRRRAPGAPAPLLTTPRTTPPGLARATRLPRGHTPPPPPAPGPRGREGPGTRTG